MNAFEFLRWVTTIVEAAHYDKVDGKRRFGDDFPMSTRPKSLNPQGAVNLAAQIYNAVYGKD